MSKKHNTGNEELNTESDFNYHPSQDKTSRFAVDALLRKYGFRIYSRRKNKQPLWIKDGYILTIKEALSTIDEDEVWGAEYEEYCYFYTIGLSEDCDDYDDPSPDKAKGFSK